MNCMFSSFLIALQILNIIAYLLEGIYTVDAPTQWIRPYKYRMRVCVFLCVRTSAFCLLLSFLLYGFFYYIFIHLLYLYYFYLFIHFWGGRLFYFFKIVADSSFQPLPNPPPHRPRRREREIERDINRKIYMYEAIHLFPLIYTALFISARK